MNTPGHIVVSLAALGKKDRRKFSLQLALGGVAPDIPIFLFYLYHRLYLKTPELLIWSEEYFRPNWQNTFDTFHSIPLLGLAALLLYKTSRKGAFYFFSAMLLHSAIDLPLHSDDAHRHFFPFLDWKFVSPVSYWDPRHFGWLGVTLELLVVFGAGLWVLKWNKKKWVKNLLFLIFGFYAAGTILLALYLNEIV